MRVKGQLPVMCLLLLLVTSVTACNRGRGVQAARDDRAATASESEQNFMMKAAQANLVEIKAARIALEKSDNNDVKDYANMIKNDHTSALEDLADVMKDQNVQQPKIDSDTQQDIDRMSNLSGGEFDREFVNMMVSDHEKAIELFRDQQSSAQNRDVKSYVNQALPKLEMHLDKALRLQTKVFSAPNKPLSRPPTTR